MVTGEDEQKGIDVLKNVYFSMENLRSAHPQEFIFMNKMRSPAKKLQGKYRFQVLARLKSNKLLEEIYAVAAAHTTAETLVYIEENPNNLS